MEIGIIEGAVTLILKHYKAHFDLQQKIAHLFFREILHSSKSKCFDTFCKGFKSGSSLGFCFCFLFFVFFFKCPILQCFRNKGATDRIPHDLFKLSPAALLDRRQRRLYLIDHRPDISLSSSSNGPSTL